MYRGLLFFPAEIRNMIYEELISIGEVVSMMRTCGQVCREMVPLVDMLATYKMYVNYPGEGDFRKSWLGRRNGESVQNVEIHWLLPCEANDYCQRPAEEALSGLSPDVARRGCTLYMDRMDYMATWIYGADVILLRSKLSGFSWVELRLGRHWERLGTWNVERKERATLENVSRLLKGAEERPSVERTESGLMVRLGGIGGVGGEQEREGLRVGCIAWY